MENKQIVKAVIKFRGGEEISLNLYPEDAPITVKNFVALCGQGFYDGLCFHRIIDKFMIQGGGFVFDKRGLVHKDAKSIKGEFKSNGVNNGLRHKAGTISMARTPVKDSASNQFFICVADTPFLDGEYAAFGECADRQSLETAIKLGKVETTTFNGYADVPVNPVVIESIRIV